MTNLTIYQPSGSVEEWLDRGKQIRDFTSSQRDKLDVAEAFAWGWWLQEGEFKFGEAYAQGEALTGKEAQTLANYKWLAGVYSRDEVESRPNLSLKHYKVVAGRDYREDRLKLLDQAHDERIGANAFENMIKAQNRHSKQNTRSNRSNGSNGKYETTYQGQPYPDDMKFELAVQNHKLERKLDNEKAKVAVTSYRVERAQRLLSRIIEKAKPDNPVFNELQELKSLLLELAEDPEVEGWSEFLRYWRNGHYAAAAEIMEHFTV